MVTASHYIDEGETYNFGTGFFGLFRLTIVNTTTYAAPCYIIISGEKIIWLNREWYIYDKSDVTFDSGGNLIIHNEGAGQTFILTKIA